MEFTDGFKKADLQSIGAGAFRLVLSDDFTWKVRTMDNIAEYLRDRLGAQGLARDRLYRAFGRGFRLSNIDQQIYDTLDTFAQAIDERSRASERERVISLIKQCAFSYTEMSLLLQKVESDESGQ